MAKLTDTQLVILSAANQRESRTVYPLPKTIKLNKAAVSKVLKSLLKHQLIAEREASGREEVWRLDGQAKLTLVLTEAGLAALDGGQSSKSAQPKVKQPQPPSSNATSKSPATAAKKAAGNTKLGQLVELLKRKSGATLPEAMSLTGWQAHSVRGAMSGAIKRKLSLNITTETTARGRVYRIVP